jgi:hypothetical protein
LDLRCFLSIARLDLSVLMKDLVRIVNPRLGFGCASFGPLAQPVGFSPRFRRNRSLLLELT